MRGGAVQNCDQASPCDMRSIAEQLASCAEHGSGRHANGGGSTAGGEPAGSGSGQSGGKSSRWPAYTMLAHGCSNGVCLHGFVGRVGCTLSLTRSIAAASWRGPHTWRQLAAAAHSSGLPSKRRSCCRDCLLGHLWSRLVQALSQALCWLPAGDCCSPAVVPGGCAGSRPCQRAVRERIKAGGAGKAQPRGLPCEGATLVAAAGNVGGRKHRAFVSMALQSGETQRATALPAAAAACRRPRPTAHSLPVPSCFARLQRSMKLPLASLSRSVIRRACPCWCGCMSDSGARWRGCLQPS